MKITYSQYNSQKLTEVYDSLLDFRDELCFATLLRGCRRGFLEGRENGKRKQGRIKVVCNAVLWILLLWGITFLLKMHFFPTDPYQAFEEAIWIAVVCVILYAVFLGPRSLRIYKTDDWYYSDSAKCRWMLWENRKDCPDHILYRPYFYGLSVRKAKRRIRRAEKGEGDTDAQQLLRRLYENAYDLSGLRCVCTISEEIQRYADLCGMENLEISFKEDRRLTYKSPEEVYRIELTGKLLADPDSVIPVEAEAKSVTFTMPYTVGKELARRYRRKERLDLAVMDNLYKVMRSNFGNYKKTARKLLQEQGADENSAVLQAMEKVKF